MQHFGLAVNTFLHLILICHTDFIFLQAIYLGFQDSKISDFKIMVTELLIVWIVGVVAFFVLWAILLKVIKRISEKKSQTKDTIHEEVTEKEAATDTLN